MNTLILRMEAFAGSSVTDATASMVAFANQAQVTVMVGFNGIELMACPGDSAEKMVEEYYRLLPSGLKNPIARGRPE